MRTISGVKNLTVFTLEKKQTNNLTVFKTDDVQCSRVFKTQMVR